MAVWTKRKMKRRLNAHRRETTTNNERSACRIVTVTPLVRRRVIVSLEEAKDLQSSVAALLKKTS
jgi:hypothetical protein